MPDIFFFFLSVSWCKSQKKLKFATQLQQHARVTDVWLVPLGMELLLWEQKQPLGRFTRNLMNLIPEKYVSKRNLILWKCFSVMTLCLNLYISAFCVVWLCPLSKNHPPTVGAGHCFLWSHVGWVESTTSPKKVPLRSQIWQGMSLLTLRANIYWKHVWNCENRSE